MKLADWIFEAARRLAEAGVDEPRVDATLLAAHGLGQDRSWVLSHATDEIDVEALEPLLARRLRREPLPYITGRKEWRDFVLEVNPSVLIPRPETELLVDVALEEMVGSITALDLGTGSGCVAIAFARERPGWEVTASDIDAGALQVAQRNAEANDAQLKFVEHDGVPPGAWDLIVSNPPYVAPSDALPPEIAQFEPAVALFGPDDDGLGFYRRLAAEATHSASVIAVEVGAGQAKAVRAIFEVSGWRHRRTVRDLAGIERVVVVEAG